MDGVETVPGGEGPWLPGLERMTPGVIVVDRNPVCTDAVGMAVMSYSPQATEGTSPFIRGDNSLHLAEAVGVSIKDAKIDFGPGAVGKTMKELRA